MDTEKEEFCARVESCVDSRNKPVCGIKSKGNRYQVKMFENECDLLKFGCAVEKDEEGMYLTHIVFLIVILLSRKAREIYL